MWLYFNENGQLIETLEHGNVARSGTTNFEIFAFFNNVDVPNLFSNATIKLRKPDLSGSEYPLLLMKLETKRFVKVSESEETNYFEVDKEYTGYYFNFADFNDSQDSEILLDTPGMWQAVITLIGSDRRLNVQGVVNFYVENGVFDEKGHEISIDSLLNPIYTELSQKLDINSFGTTYRKLKKEKGFVEKIDKIAGIHLTCDSAKVMITPSNTKAKIKTSYTVSNKIYFNAYGTKYCNHASFDIGKETSFKELVLKLINDTNFTEDDITVLETKTDEFYGKVIANIFKTSGIDSTCPPYVYCYAVTVPVAGESFKAVPYIGDHIPTTRLAHKLFWLDTTFSGGGFPARTKFMMKFVRDYEKVRIPTKPEYNHYTWTGNMANVWLECQVAVWSISSDEAARTQTLGVALRFIPKHF